MSLDNQAAPTPSQDPRETRAVRISAARSENTNEIRFSAWCALTGRPFLIVAAPEGADSVRILRSELPACDGDAPVVSYLPPPPSSKRILRGKWSGCPHCGTTCTQGVGALWVCENDGCEGPLHCAGNREGRYRCACGIVEPRQFASADDPDRIH